MLLVSGALLIQRQELLSIDWYVAGRLDAEANLASIDIHNCDANVVADENLFPKFPAEHEHVASLLRAWLGSCVARCGVHVLFYATMVP